MVQQHLQKEPQRTKEQHTTTTATTNNKNNKNRLAIYGSFVVGAFLLRLLAETHSVVLWGAPSTPTSSSLHHAATTTTNNHDDEDDAWLALEMDALETDDFTFAMDHPDTLVQNNDWVAIARRVPFSIQDASASYAYTSNTTSLQDMLVLATDFFGGTLCHRLLPPNSTTTLEDLVVDDTPTTAPPRMISVRFHCQTLFEKGGLGTGNYMSAIYGLRLAAARLGHVNVEFLCNDAEHTQDDLILPWVTGWFPPPSRSQFPVALPSVATACSDYKTIPLTYMVPAMQWELRRMAVALVGIPYPGHPAEAWANEHVWNTTADAQFHATMQVASPSRNAAPLYQNVELDDAVLHFRCGDLISSTHPSFGFMKFGSFSRHLPDDIQSIGIVTQPFNASGQNRNFDGGDSKKQRCKLVVYAFVEHLQEAFPAAKISIRNDDRETIALTFARMVMAQHVVVAISSFGVFPAVATFGNGYIRKPDYAKAPNRWLLFTPTIEEAVDNVKLIEEPKLMAIQCRRMWGRDGSAVIEWFKNYTMAPV